MEEFRVITKKGIDIAYLSPTMAQSLISYSNYQRFNKKNLGVLIAKNKRGITTGIISDGDFKRINYK